MSQTHTIRVRQAVTGHWYWRCDCGVGATGYRNDYLARNDGAAHQLAVSPPPTGPRVSAAEAVRLLYPEAS